MSQKEQLESFLKEITALLESDKYSQDYVFIPGAVPHHNDFKHERLKDLVRDMKQNGVSFDYNMILQKIEMRILDRFNSVVDKHITDQSMESLCKMMHEVDKFRLTREKEILAEKLARIEKEEPVLEVKVEDAFAEDVLEEEAKEKVVEIKKKKANKK